MFVSAVATQDRVQTLPAPGSAMPAMVPASPLLMDYFFLWSQQWHRGHGGPQPPSHTSSSSRSAASCILPSSQSSSYWFSLWLLQPVVQLGWSRMTGHALGTHLAHSRRLVPGNFLRDLAPPVPLDSPGCLWTLRREREGSWPRVVDFRGDIPW